MRACSYCGASLDGKRRDALTCSKRCRQNVHTFRRSVEAGVVTTLPRRLAYADKP